MHVPPGAAGSTTDHEPSAAVAVLSDQLVDEQPLRVTDTVAPATAAVPDVSPPPTVRGEPATEVLGALAAKLVARRATVVDVDALDDA